MGRMTRQKETETMPNVNLTEAEALRACREVLKWTATQEPRPMWLPMVEAAENALLDSGDLVECGCCGERHFAEFSGDCRDDLNRF